MISSRRPASLKHFLYDLHQRLQARYDLRKCSTFPYKNDTLSTSGSHSLHFLATILTQSFIRITSTISKPFSSTAFLTSSSFVSIIPELIKYPPFFMKPPAFADRGIITSARIFATTISASKLSRSSHRTGSESTFP